MLVALLALPLLSTFFITSHALQVLHNITRSTPLSSITIKPQIANTTVQNKTTAVAVNGTLTKSNHTEETETPFLFYSFFGKTAIGDSCKTTDDCSIKEAFCVNGICECSSEYVPSPNKRMCLIKAKSLLDTCTDNIQCEAGLNATGLVSCIAFKCICDLDAILVQGKCYKRLGLGNECKNSAECSVPYSSCIQNICACNTHMEPHEDNNRCVVMKSIIAPSTNCTDDHMCNMFGELYQCRNGRCACKPGYHFSGDQCISELSLGETCNKNSDCLVDMEVEKTGLRECRDNACMCIKDYKANIRANLCTSTGSLFTVNLFLLFLLLSKLLI